MLKLAGHTKIINDKEIEVYLTTHPTHWTTVRVRIYKYDGSTYEKWLPTPQDDKETPLDYEALCVKFEHLTSSTPYAAAATHLCDIVSELEKVEPVAALLHP